jgi:exonuclease III
LSEPRITGKHIITEHGFKMYFSGGTSKHEHGVSLWIRQALPHTVEYVDPVSDRILVVAGVFNDVTLCFVVAYGPAATGDEEADLERRTEFFKQLDEVIANLPQRYRLRKIVLGDFNARLGHSSDFLPDTF